MYGKVETKVFNNPLKPKIDVFKEQFLTTKTIFLPNFNIVPQYVSEANFYISQWKLEIKLVNKLENNSLRNIRSGYDVHGMTFENINIGNYSASLPFTSRGSNNTFTVTASKQGLGSGAFYSLMEAFLTGYVRGEFKIDAKGCAFLLCTEKQFYVRGVFPVKKVNVFW